jgi:Rps23 Pro-64 3,4-dihydroxylase Tpa1-like proline 4-hydroxylase
MTEKELRKLGRGDLLNLLLEQSRENQKMREQLQALQDALADKTLCIDRAGSIAEASLQLSGVFQAAEQACRMYTQNIMQLNQRQEAICAQREKEGQEKAAQIVNDAQKQAKETIAITQKQCAEMLEKAQAESQKCRDAVSEKLASISSERAELRQLLSQLSAQGGDDK